MAGIQYVGPYSPAVYDAAKLLASGSPGTPYAPSVLNAAQSVVQAQPDVLGAATSAPNDPNNSGGSSTPVVDKSNDIKLQQSGLTAADTQRTGGLQAITDALRNLFGKYTTESQANETNYTTQADTNQNNLQRNKQAALVSAAQGRQGLFGTLASLGALSGSGIDLATRAVQQGANADISGAQDTFGENQTGLDTSISEFRRQDEQRRRDAEEAAKNARTGVENQVSVNKQKFYSNLADDYSQMGNKGEAARYADLAASLFPSIAGSSIPSSANIAYTGAAYTPATLSNYLGGAGDTSVSTTPTAGSTLPGLVASTTRRRRDQGAVPAV